MFRIAREQNECKSITSEVCDLFRKLQSNLVLTDEDIKDLFYFVFLQKHRVDKNNEAMREILQRHITLKCEYDYPHINSDELNDIISNHFNINKNEHRLIAYKAIIDEIETIIDCLNFEEYEIRVLSNDSSKQFISSDNPVCMVNPVNNIILQTGDLANTTVFLFPLGYRKLALIYKRAYFRTTKRKLNDDDVTLINSILATNAKNLLIIPEGFSEKQIMHWLGTIRSSHQETYYNKVCSIGLNDFVGIFPAYSTYQRPIKFIKSL